MSKKLWIGLSVGNIGETDLSDSDYILKVQPIDLYNELAIGMIEYKSLGFEMKIGERRFGSEE